MSNAPITPTSRPIQGRSPGISIAALFELIVHLFLDASTAQCASRSFFAQSSQHTSTVFPPILTLIRFASSLLSQAAHVLGFMTPPAISKINAGEVGHARAVAAVKIFSDLFWEGLTVQRGPPEFR